MAVTDRQTDPPKSNLVEENNLTESVINGLLGRGVNPLKMEAAGSFETLITLY
jgi:hypothetical protein